MSTMTITDGGRFLLAQTIDHAMPSGEVVATLSTANSFVDKDIDIKLTLPTAVATITGTNTVTPSASLSQTNVTFSTTNNGISVTATGGGTASVTASANITTAGYAPSGNGFKTQTLSASNNTTTATKYITGITVPKDKGFTITMTADTALDTSSDLDVTNAAYRRLDITNPANGTALISNAGNVTTTQSAKTGTIKINAYNTSNATSLAGEKTIVENGVWKAVAVAAANTDYYGKVTAAAVSGSIGGSASSGAATATIEKGSGSSTLNATTTQPSGTEGTNYWKIVAKATGTAGSYTPKYTVSTAGWIASTVTGSAQTVAVTSDTTGTAMYIPKATFTVSNNNVNVNTAGFIASGTVGTITSKNIVVSATDPGSSYTNKTDLVLPIGGWLKLDAGYYSAQRISLATLVPDSIDDAANGFASANYIRAGYGAFDKDGAAIIGTLATYDGSYTTS